MKRYHGYQFKQAVEELTRKIASEFGCKISDIYWKASIPTAGTNNRGDIYFCDVHDDSVLYDIDVQRYVGYAVHEMLHQKYTDFNVRGGEDYLDQLHNACEDAWIEHTGIDNALTGNIGGLLTALLDQLVDEANVTVADWADPRQYPFIFAVYLRRHLNCYVPVPDGLEPIINQASEMILDCKSSADTLRVAQWIMDQLNNLPKNPPPTPQSKESKGEGRLSGNPHPSAGNARRPAKDQEVTPVEPKNKVTKGKRGIGSWSESASLVSEQEHVRASGAWVKEDPAVPARLRYEVKRLFDNSGLEEFQRNRRSGAINVNALHKVSVTDKVFQRRLETEGIDSAVVIAIDVSGSMFDEGDEINPNYGRSERIVQAILTAQALVDTLHKSQVATCVLAFGSNTSVVKPFNAHPTKARAKIKALKEGGGTNDYFAVRYAHKLLLGRPEQRKIAFVITDGMGRPDYVRRQCQSGNNLGITTIGIGIENDVRSVYPQAVNIRSAKDLGAVSFKQIKLAV